MAILNRYYLAFLFFFPLVPAYIGIRSGAGLINIQRLLFIPLALLVFASLLQSSGVLRLVERSVSRSRLVFWLFFSFLLCRVLGSIFSVDFSATIKTTLYELFFYLTLLFATLAYLKDEQRIMSLIRILAFSVMVASLLALIERLLERNLFLELVDVGGSDDYLMQALSSKVRGDYRVQSTFYNPLSFAHYLLIVVPLVLTSDKRRAPSLAKFKWLFVALAAFALYFTGSRAAVLILGAELAAFFYINAKRAGRSEYVPSRALSAVLRLVILVSAVAAAVFGLDRVVGGSEEEVSSSLARVVQVMQGLDVMADRPFFGVGTRLAADYVGVSVNEERVSVDNYYLSIAVENGIPALLIFLSLLLALYFSLKRRIPVNGEVSRFGLYMALFSISSFFLISSLYDEVLPLFVVIVAVVMAKVRIAADSKRLSPRESVSC